MIPIREVGAALVFVMAGLAWGGAGGVFAATGWRGSKWECFWPVYVTYLIVSGLLGLSSRGRAWLAGLAGAVMVPAHFVVFLMNDEGPDASTRGVGYGIALIASIPPAMSGYYVGKRIRTRRKRE